MSSSCHDGNFENLPQASTQPDSADRLTSDASFTTSMWFTHQSSPPRPSTIDREREVAQGSLIRPWHDSRLTRQTNAHFQIRPDSIMQYRSNGRRARLGPNQSRNLGLKGKKLGCGMITGRPPQSRCTCRARSLHCALRRTKAQGGDQKYV
jgi:hypothetical protein